MHARVSVRAWLVLLSSGSLVAWLGNTLHYLSSLPGFMLLTPAGVLLYTRQRMGGASNRSVPTDLLCLAGHPY